MAEVEEDEDSDWSGYESGPFCEHWADPLFCDRLCNCGHACHEHRDGGRCYECRCEQFADWDAATAG